MKFIDCAEMYTHQETYEELVFSIRRDKFDKFIVIELKVSHLSNR